MKEPQVPARMEFSLKTSPQNQARRTDLQPMRLLILGDFSGKPAIERPALASRPTHRVDFDNLDAVIQRLAPRLQLPMGDIGFEQIDDFHPDRLDPWLQARPGQAPSTAAAAEPGPAMATRAPDTPDNAPSKTPDDGLLARLLGGQPAQTPQASTPEQAIEALIRGIVAAPSSGQAVAAIMAGKQASHQPQGPDAERLRGLLHTPAFQSLEAAWRGVQWLVSSLELDDTLQLHLFDISRDEWRADVVAAQGHVEQTALCAALIDRWPRTNSAPHWAALVGLFQFGPSDADIDLLAALGQVAARAGCPLLAGGDLALADHHTGDDNPSSPNTTLASWHDLRRSEVAPWISLAAPRLLLRLPYGRRGDPVPGFAFEEFSSVPVHEHYLWGSGALACAWQIGQGFSARGWAFEPGDTREIGGLPAYSFEQDGEPTLQACAEFYGGDARAEALLGAGLTPLLSHRHRNAATVMRLQSIAEPPTALAGLGQLA